MADEDARPLSDEERAELEALRAEKARRERAELEALRAEEAHAEHPAPVAPPPAQRPAASAPAPSAPKTAPRPAEPVVAEDPAERTFGQRMVLSGEEDADGLPAMPPAQKIIIGVCLLAAVCFIVYMALSGAGVLD